MHRGKMAYYNIIKQLSTYYWSYNDKMILNHLSTLPSNDDVLFI